jgi:hypothetical protein
MTEIERKALLARLLDFNDNWHEASCKEAADTIEAQAAEIARLREAMKWPLAWLESWAVHVGNCSWDVHVGNCETNPECTCGLMFAQHELRAALEAKP